MLLALLRQYVRPYRRLVAVLMVLQLIGTLASLYLPTVNAAIIDDGVSKGDTATIVRLGLVMAGVTGLQVLCSVGAIYFGSRTGMGFGRDLRSAMFEQITTFSERETARFGATTLLIRTTNDVRQIQFLIQMAGTALVIAPITCVGGIIMAVHQEAALTWLLLVSIPVMGVTNYWIISHMLPLFRSMQSLIDGINRVMRDQLSGVRVVRAFTRESFERDRFAKANIALSNTAVSAGNWQALMLPVTTLTVNLSSVAVIWFGGLLIDRGQMQVGSLSAFLSYFAQILMAVLMASMTLVVMPRASACAERIAVVLSTSASIGLVPQRGYLFSGTVADNLRYGAAPDQVVTDDEMWDALRVAAADGFVRAHDDGLKMRVAQGGINFSGGQRQRLAIARAVIRRPAIYLFDDAFSALDVHTDSRVRASLRKTTASATIIIVTQRISLAAQADQLIVIDNGKIVGTGTHESLLADCATYAEFAASQSLTGTGVGGRR